MGARWWRVGVLVALTGCGASPVGPLPSRKPPSPPPLEVGCVAGETLRCNAFIYGEGDVTAASTWTAHESIRAAWAVPMPDPSDAVVFSSNGVVTAVRAANVYVRAEYVSVVWGVKRSYTSVAYAVGGSVPADRLAYADMSVRLSDRGSFDDFSGVRIDIVAGEGEGKSCVTATSGFCEIEFLHLDRPFTVRASKPGYTSETLERPGITFVDVNPTRGTGFPSGGSAFITLSPGS